ncbi:MAG TPA: ATP-grasp domain-containing protein [Anaerolineales bacterium]|nr:ATP-grasp domain-containing protein [Anaerolineales bacterium]
MLTILFTTPIFNDLATRVIKAIGSLPDVRLGVISQKSQEMLSPEVRAHIVANWQVDNVLDAGQLVWAAESLAKQLGPVHRLLAINEQIQVPIAEAREHFGVAGTRAEVAKNFRDKSRMKDLLRAAGLPCARHRLVTSKQEAWEFVGVVGFPVVVKPPAGAASQATFRAASAEELRHTLWQILPHPKQPVLLEEFITGEEYSFDTFSINGKAVWHSWTHYLPAPLEVTRNDWMQWRVVLPREVDDNVSEAIRPAGVQALEVLGMETGLSHLEWFHRADGSVAISEVGMRPPGAQITTLMSRAHDFDCVTAWARLMVLGEFEPPVRKYAAGAAYLRGQGWGRVRGVNGYDQVQRELGDWITDVKLPQIGQEKSASYEGEGYIILCHPETEFVEQGLLHIINSIRIALG